MLVDSELNRFIHDISTPLTMVKINLDQFRDKPDTLLINRIEAGIEELSYLVSANSLSNKQKVFRSTAIKEIKKILQMYELTFARENILLTTDFQEDFFLVKNIDKFHRVIINLLNNSVGSFKQLYKIKRIEISTFRTELGFNLSIADNGCGIKEENLRRLFNQQFTTKTNGNGLGLINVKKILFENFNGIIICNSTCGKGSKFEISMPDPSF